MLIIARSRVESKNKWEHVSVELYFTSIWAKQDNKGSEGHNEGKVEK